MSRKTTIRLTGAEDARPSLGDLLQSMTASKH